MVNQDTKSNSNVWELEILCINHEYLKEVVDLIVSHGCIDFEVNTQGFSYYHDDTFNGRYTVLAWCNGFDRLSEFSKQLKKIENKLKNTHACPIHY